MQQAETNKALNLQARYLHRAIRLTMLLANGSRDTKKMTLKRWPSWSTVSSVRPVVSISSTKTIFETPTTLSTDYMSWRRPLNLCVGFLVAEGWYFLADPLSDRLRLLIILSSPGRKGPRISELFYSASSSR